MLTSFQHGPGRRRKAHAANVEVSEARSTLVEDVFSPGKLALTGGGVSLSYKLIEQVTGQTIDFNDYDTLGLRAADYRNQKQETKKNEGKNSWMLVLG
jgi:hypothetical protein